MVGSCYYMRIYWINIGKYEYVFILWDVVEKDYLRFFYVNVFIFVKMFVCKFIDVICR